MFMGNGEQYIWKPPEDDDMLMLQNKALGPLGAHTVENIQPSAAAVSEDSSSNLSVFCYITLSKLHDPNVTIKSF